MAASNKEFSVSEKLSALAKLQQLCSKLDKLQILKGELPMEINDLEDVLVGLNRRKTNTEESINGVVDFIESKKNAIADAEALLKKYEAQSENVKNSREFDAINSEINLQHLEIKACEKGIKDANIQLAGFVKDLEELNKKIEQRKTILTEKQSALGKIIAETEKDEKVVLQNIEEQRKKMDERLLYSFDRIRNNYRNGLAVVPVERDACGGCFNSIPPQKQSEIRQRKKIMVCENCGRILVDDEINEAAMQA